MVDTAAEADLRWLVDRARISELLHRYAFDIDTRSWDSWKKLFLPDVIGEYPAVTYRGRDELTAGISRIDRWAATQHLSTNHQIEIDGDRARSVSYLQAVHVPQAGAKHEHYDMGGWYLHEFVRTPAGWRISRLKLVQSWSLGEAHRSRLREGPDPRFGRADMAEARGHLRQPDLEDPR